MYSTSQAEKINLYFLKSVIFFAEMLSLSHYKYESNHLPKIGDISSLTPPYPNDTAQSLIQHSLLYFSLLQTGLEINMCLRMLYSCLWVLPNYLNCFLACVCFFDMLQANINFKCILQQILLTWNVLKTWT